MRKGQSKYKKELNKRLEKHERSQAWLGRKLNLSPMAICKMCSGQLKIGDIRLKEIRKLLP